MNWRLYHKERKQKMAILVSKTSHCLYEVLLKHQDGQLNCDIPVIISNHPDLCGVATEFHIPFFQIDTGKGKEAVEADIQRILEQPFILSIQSMLFYHISCKTTLPT